MLRCFPCFSPGLVPPNHVDLTREEVKRLFELSVPLNDGRLIVHGIFARADTRNNNKRVYPKAILKREVAKFQYDHIQNGTALGELDHPNYASRYFRCLNLPNVSHQVLEVEWRHNQLWGTIEILRTPSGLLLWELYSQGIRLGVSSRGWASLYTDPRDKCIYVDKDFELITFDFVTEPSTSGAYLVPIRKTYRKTLPDQSKCTKISHLGYGVLAMENISRLPDAHMIAERVSHLYAEHAKAAAGTVVPGPRHGNNLDKLLKFGHYIVHKDAPFLESEPNAREYGPHLAMFAVRAHLADQEQLLARGDVNAVILQEMALGGGNIIQLNNQLGQHLTGGPSATPAPPPDVSSAQSKDLDDSSTSVLPSSLTTHPPPAPPSLLLVPPLPPTTHPPSNDLGSWSLHPNALCIDSQSPTARPPQPPPSGDVAEPGAAAAGFSDCDPSSHRPLTGQSSSSLAPCTSSVHSASSISVRHKAPGAEPFTAAGRSSARRVGGTGGTTGGTAGGTEAVPPADGRAASPPRPAGQRDATGPGTSLPPPIPPAASLPKLAPQQCPMLFGEIAGAGGAAEVPAVINAQGRTSVAVAAGLQTTPTEVAVEFQLVKTTLAHFVERYQAGQAAVREQLFAAGVARNGHHHRHPHHQGHHR